ncbi:transcriptional regulator, LacI family [Kribbella flavida DSM 17836]|uniref:Transcriptional regulator, LacI family n=1 Tax=Kribbella flavida (strain DSM 17836 / JCM 10339 / NBRC 14399) TaxID=479435 RepID=D2Q525_KRIFD|nr:LacI family DNA-binding transcriptional regulator [Kribbella flavida]ADB36036.1 transcriptional regulator, LacI family [Kribbella flavida DSM 17836]
MPRRVTVRDIAAETGVSIATVSRVLNHSASVAPATRDLVEQAVERLGATAPGPRGGTPKPAAGAVYVRCPYLLTDYFGLIVSSIAETLDRHGRQLVLNAGQGAASAPVLSQLAAGRSSAGYGGRRSVGTDENSPAEPGQTVQPAVGGAILILPPESSEELVRLRARRFPFVVVDPRTPLPRDIAAVSAAHFSGARQVTAHLAELGHRRIGVIAGPREWLASDARLSGHAAALADAGSLPDPALVRFVEPTTEWGYRAAGELLDLPERPTALVAFNDKAAVGALRAAVERGLSIPGDLSVAGFDDIDLSRATSPLLTTVRQPLQEMGRMAVSLLIRLLDRHELEALHVELATELVIRDSTGPAPGAA